MIIATKPIVILLFFGLTSAAAAQTMSADESAVWALEEAYWESVKANDIEGYRTLWDERFVGWPGFSRQPLGKDSIHHWIAPLHENPSRTYDYRLTQEAVRAFGPDIVVAHYLVRGFFRSVDTNEIVGSDRVSRITHTKQRRGNSRQILTGMYGTLVGDD